MELGKNRNHIRIFISSTFKDMQDERNILVKKVFPRLRIEAEKRGIMFSYVDLRWGVVPNSSPSEIIEICLSEIENCAPFFLGLIGYNYGTNIPTIDSYKKNSIDSKHKGFKELLQERMSYTELEMRYNLLYNNNDIKSYIYIKEEPSIRTSLKSFILFIKRLLLKHFSNYTSLTNLKDYVRLYYTRNITSYPANTTFDKSKTFEDIVYNDFIQYLEQNFQQEEHNKKPYIRYSQETLLKSPQRLIPRKDIQTILHNWGNQECNDTEWLILKGISGTGKTSILVEYATQEHSNLNVLYHFVGHSSTLETPELILKDLIYQICSCLNINKPAYSNEETKYDLGKILTQYLQVSHNKTIIIIDDINSISCETDALMSIISWLPNSVENLKYILSFNSNKIHIQKYPEWVKITELELKEFTAADCYNFTKLYLQQEYSKNVGGIITQEFYEKSEKRFLRNIRNLKLFLDEVALLDFGKEKNGKDLKKEIEVISNNQRETLELVLHRIETDIFKNEKSKAIRILSFLAISDYGIHENDIITICSDPHIEITQIDWVKLYCQIKPHIISYGYIKLNKDIRNIIIHRYLWNTDTLNEYRCKLASGLRELSFNNLYMLETVNNYLQANDSHALMDTLSLPTVVTFIYYHNKEILFDCMRSLKSHNLINKLMTNIINSIESIKDYSIQINYFEIIAKILTEFPVHDIALLAISRAIRLQELLENKNTKATEQLAGNYIKRIDLLIRLYKLKEAQEELDSYFNFLSEKKQFIKGSSFYVNGIIAKAKTYYNNSSVIEKQKAYILFIEAIEKTDKNDKLKYISLLNQCCFLCIHLLNKEEFSRLLGMMHKCIEQNFIFGTESYYEAILKIRNIERFEMHLLKMDVEAYENRTDELIKELQTYIELYGRKTRISSVFHTVIGNYYDEIASIYKKRNEYTGYVRNLDKALYYRELDFQIVSSIFRKDDIVYANSLFEISKVYQSLIETRPLEKSIYIQKCLTWYKEAEYIYRELFPCGHWSIAKVYHNQSMIYKEIKNFVEAKECIDKAILMKSKLIDNNSISIHASYIRKLHIYKAEFLDKEIHDIERIKEYKRLINDYISLTRKCTKLSEQEKESRIQEIIEYKIWLNNWELDTKSCHIKHAKETIEVLKKMITDYKLRCDKKQLPELLQIYLKHWATLQSYIIIKDIEEDLETDQEYLNIKIFTNQIINAIKE